MKKLTFMLLLGACALCGCNVGFETPSPVGNAVWDGSAVPATETAKEVDNAKVPCTRCGIIEQKKELDAIAQDMLEKYGEIRVPEVPALPEPPAEPQAK